MLFILFILTALFLVFALSVRNCCLENKKRKNLVCCVGFCGRDTPLCTLSFPQNFLGACIGFLVLSVIINIFLNLAGLAGTGNQAYYYSDLSVTSKLTGSWIALFVVLLFVTQIAPLTLLCIGYAKRIGF
ncbi:hypothetical protein ADEAN_000151100 [Angomonas deanei]|uniref:Amastin surface glycoprotein n=1 Tax=Angomonas deanei TaxID=59799 RepID=A0A7G2C5P5_9TRYP|nr:hypothetical protein ADEAN_000151100 [Angomonas deanei]